MMGVYKKDLIKDKEIGTMGEGGIYWPVSRISGSMTKLLWIREAQRLTYHLQLVGIYTSLFHSPIHFPTHNPPSQIY